LPKKKYTKFKFIYILFTGTHYNVITKINVFLNYKYYCNFCKVGYQHNGNHFCNQICKFCNRDKQRCEVIKQKLCEFCLEKSNNEKCFKLHQERVCEIINKCNQRTNYHSPHVCEENEFYCRNCSKVVDLEHKCFIKRLDEKKFQKKIKPQSMIFFDYETYKDHTNIHIPNLAMAQKICIDFMII